MARLARAAMVMAMTPASSFATSFAFVVRCLSCGTLRIVRRTTNQGLDRPDCLLCGYVGWAEDGPAPDTLSYS